MLIKPKKLSTYGFDRLELSEDTARIRKIGSCGISGRALYLGTYFLDRRYYVPFEAVQRVFKRIAMSKGGFTGRGIFASIAYLVVQYDNGKEYQCSLKREEYVDEILAQIRREHPEVKTLSKEAEERLEKYRKEQEKRFLKKLSPEAQESVDKLRREKAYLDEVSEVTEALSRVSKQKRASDTSKMSLKWLAFVIVLLGAAALIYGGVSLIRGTGDFGIYFLIFGLAAIFLFSGVSVLPTGRTSRKNLIKQLDSLYGRLGDYIEDYGEKFDVPARYAHPVVIDRMIRIIREGRAMNAPDALEVLKDELRAATKDVQVSQEEYDEIVAIKPMFLINGYN